MLKNKYSLPTTSTMTVHRMRYRAPMESYKYNKFANDSSNDIEILFEMIEKCRQDLTTYISEAISGCDDPVTIFENGETIFTGVCSTNIDTFNNKNNLSLRTSREVKYE